MPFTPDGWTAQSYQGINQPFHVAFKNQGSFSQRGPIGRRGEIGVFHCTEIRILRRKSTEQHITVKCG